MSHAVLTGPIRGSITLDDGTVYDVNDLVVHVASPEHAQELADKIGDHYAEHGHPHHEPGHPFKHDKRKKG